MTNSDKAIIATALVPACIFLTFMLALLILQPFEVPGGVIPAAGVVVTIGSIAFANVLRLRRDRRSRGNANC